MRLEKTRAKTLPKTRIGAVCKQYKKCGKPNCHCARGELHGPYQALFWRESGKLRKRYVSKHALAEVMATCKAKRELQQWKRENRREVMEQWRQIAATLGEALNGSNSSR